MAAHPFLASPASFPLLRCFAGTALLVLGLSPAALAQSDSTSDTTVTLPQVDVQGRRATALDPVPGFTATQSTAGAKTDTPLLETPQAVSVITRDQIDAQQAIDTASALRYSSGVMSEPFGNDIRYGWPRVRGFNLMNYQFLDGLRLPSGTYAIPQVEPWGLERIEILRGPSSVLYGQIPPGGMLAYTSRRPTETPFGELQLQAGSYERFQGAFDLGGPVPGTDGQFLYRLTGMGRSAETQVSEVHDNRLFIAPALTWRPSADTSLTLLSYFQRDDSGVTQFLPSQGTLRPNPYGRIPVDFFTGEKNANNFDRDQWGVGYQFQHRFDNVWTVRQNLRYSRIDFDMSVLRGLGLQADLRTLNRAMVHIRDQSDAFTVDNQLESRFDTGPLRHTVLFGLDYRRGTSDLGFGRGTASTLDIFNPVRGLPYTVPTSFNVTNTLTTQNQTGLYLQDQIRFGGWLLTLSGRHDWADTETDNRLTRNSTTQEDSAFSGRVGLNYIFDFGLSPYVAYSRSFQPQIGITSPARGSTPFDASRGEQFEVGVKYQPPGRRSMVTVAAYRLRQDNIPTTDPSNTLFQIQVGEAKVKGIEVEANGALTRDLSVIASYAYTDSEVTRTTIAAQQGKRLPQTPEHQAALWLDHTWHEGPLNGLSLAAGIRYLTGAYGDAAGAFAFPTATLFDAALRYDLGALSPSLRGFRLAVNGSNLGDKVTANCDAATECFYTARRLVLGTLSYRW